MDYVTTGHVSKCLIRLFFVIVPCPWLCILHNVYQAPREGRGINVGEVNQGCGYGGWTSVGAILVLFILLVIITKAFCV